MAWGYHDAVCRHCRPVLPAQVGGRGKAVPAVRFPAGEGNAFFRVLESALSLFVALCCLFRLHREKLLRRRGQRRAKQQPQRGGRLVLLKGGRNAPEGRGCA